LGTHRLIPHPSSPPRGIGAVDVRWRVLESEGVLMLRYMVNGRDALAAPAFAGVGRADLLWQTTCFELFLRDREGSEYQEFNFSPSQRWAAYRFHSYRDGMRNADVGFDPVVSVEEGDQLFVLTARIDARELRAASAAGLCAVIEEKCGRKSYWALAHGGDEPDFHDPACFALPLG